jgi:hypothetical protein
MKYASSVPETLLHIDGKSIVQIFSREGQQHLVTTCNQPESCDHHHRFNGHTW